MDNEGLLEWVECEVVRTKEMLRRVENHREILQNKAKYDGVDIGLKYYIETRLRNYDIPEEIWNNVEDINKLLAVLIERREYLVGGGIRERLLYE